MTSLDSPKTQSLYETKQHTLNTRSSETSGIPPPCELIKGNYGPRELQACEGFTFLSHHEKIEKSYDALHMGVLRALQVEHAKGQIAFMAGKHRGSFVIICSDNSKLQLKLHDTGSVRVIEMMPGGGDRLSQEKVYISILNNLQEEEFSSASRAKIIRGCLPHDLQGVKTETRPLVLGFLLWYCRKV
jgi:hypothetical protein